MTENIEFFYHIIHTPFGYVAVIYRERPFKIVKIRLPRPRKKELVADIKKESGGKPKRHPTAVAISESMNSYFNGKTGPNFWPPWKWLDMGGITELQKAVLVATATIPYGEVKTYKQIAEAIKKPRAYRFVGTALARNPFPILIPCHRVIRSDLTFGQFGGGAELKRKLIDLEDRNL